MWFRLSTAEFTTNIGTMNTWSITRVLGTGVSYSGNTSVDKGASFDATVTLTDTENYKVKSYTVTMDGVDITTDSVTTSDNITYSISIASVTGSVKITFVTENIHTGEEDSGTGTLYTFTISPTPSDATVILTAAGYTQDGNSINVPSGTSVSWTVSADGYTEQSGTQTISATTTKDVVLYDSSWIALPTTQKALGVTSSGTGRVSSNNAKRFSTADDTKENGILIPAGKTMHLSGLASGTYPLRFDYIYCTGNVKCPVSGSTTAIEGLVGTASNYVSANYFPMNKDGADTADIVNNFGEDYYFWIGFAGLTLNEGILAAYDTYTLMYKID